MPASARSACAPRLLAVIRACLFASFDLILGAPILGALFLGVAVSVAPLAVPAALAAEDGPRITLIRDAETETLLRTYVAPLYRAAGLDIGLLRIRVVQDAAINAFVTSGNRMYVHTGLLQKAESAGEVIGVLAHETAHVMHHDPAKLPDQMREALIKSIAAALIGVAAGVGAGQPDAGMAAMLGGQSMALRQLLSFSRAQEAGADQGGLNLLDHNRWSARGMVRMFDRLKDQELLVIDRQDAYLRSHPLSQERIDFVENHVARSSFSDRPFPPGFENGLLMVKAKLDGFLDRPVSVFRKYPATDTSAPARYARAVAEYRSGRVGDALAILDQLIREQRANPWLWEVKGQFLYETGRVRETVQALREAARLAPEQPLIRLALARALVDMEDAPSARAAVGELESALDRDHEDTEAWRLLSRAWGRLNEIGRANLALAEEAMLKEDFAMARRFAREATKRLPPGPSKLRAEDISNALKKENRP